MGSARCRAGAVVALVVALLVAGCGTAAPTPDGPAPVGTSVHRLTVDGRDRDFRLYRPAGLPGPAPLVVMLHGGGGSARGAEARFGWDALADRAGYVVAYPDGVGRSWDCGGGCCGVAGRNRIDDVGFLGAVVAATARLVPVDPRRRYVTGISEGGIMSYRMACDTTLFAALAPDSATQLGDCPHPAPASLLHLHGGLDRRIPADGTPGAGVNHITGGRSVDALVAAWRTLDRCPPPTVTTAGPVRTTAATCPDGRAVTLVVIADAGHQWPGAPAGLGDPPARELDATSVIWRFFAAHPAPAG